MGCQRISSGIYLDGCQSTLAKAQGRIRLGKPLEGAETRGVEDSAGRGIRGDLWHGFAQRLSAPYATQVLFHCLRRTNRHAMLCQRARDMAEEAPDLSGG